MKKHFETSFEYGFTLVPYNVYVRGYKEDDVDGIFTEILELSIIDEQDEQLEVESEDYQEILEYCQEMDFETNEPDFWEELG